MTQALKSNPSMDSPGDSSAQPRAVDATVNDSIAVYAYLAKTGDTSVKIAAPAGHQSETAFAARKNSGLLPDLNRAIDELRADGTLTNIRRST